MRMLMQTVILGLCFLHVQVAQAEELASLHLPDLPVMTGMRTEWVAERMVYNGHPMSIRNFSHNLSADEIMRYYASLWKVKGHGQPKPQRVGERQSIGYAYNGFTYSVQVHNLPGGSEGSLVVTRDRPYRQGPVDFPLYPNMHLIARIHSIDMGVYSETLTLSSVSPSSVTRQWYQAKLLRDGWTPQSGQQTSGAGVLAFQKGKSLCQLSFIEQHPGTRQHSMVMIHWIKG